MFIKICGITNLIEIEFINILKPDYIGFVFAESKRKVNKEEAMILSQLIDKDIKIVGVFRNNSLEYIKEVLKEVSLDVVQLHGEEDNIFINEVKKSGVEVWKAVGVKNREGMIETMNYDADKILVDGINPGCGEIFPWKYLDGININKGLILAGGINENNVIEGINMIEPIGIDVSSGVESRDKSGRTYKDRAKMEKLIGKVRRNYEGKI